MRNRESSMMGPVQFRIFDQEIAYTGRELRPHWGLEQTKTYGSLLVAFIGPCEVQTENLVDWEDRLSHDFIRAKSMLHILGEFFGTTLEAGVLYQRLFMNWAETLLRRAGAEVIRQGDDLFWIEGQSRAKLSVSIATASPVSVLIHWGINIDPTGAPVEAAGLARLGWGNSEVLSFAKELLTHYISELEEIQVAQCKVKPITTFMDA